MKYLQSSWISEVVFFCKLSIELARLGTDEELDKFTKFVCTEFKTSKHSSRFGTSVNVGVNTK